MRRLAISSACLASIAFACGASPGEPRPHAAAGVRLLRLGHFRSPTFLTAPPGDRHRRFVVERAGRIRVLVGRRKLRAPFLDIRGRVQTGGESGLLSMAFAPDYASSHRFYVYYTAPGTGAGSTLTVERFQTSAADPDVVDMSSRHTLLTIAHPNNANHNGGQLQFGPDGMLYAGTGDGGSSNDPPPPDGNAQNPGVLLGKLLRIDPATGAAAIHARGLRNPWRFSFD